MAAVRGIPRQGCRILPEGSVVVVESISDAVQTVNVRCQNEELWMFGVDLEERGSPQPQMPELGAERLRLPTPLHLRSEGR